MSSFLNPVVTDGTFLDNFESNSNVNLWGGTWLTFVGGASTIVPATGTFAASTGGYNSTYCGKIQVALHKGTLTYNPYAGLTTNLNSNGTLVDLTKATGFRYWFKGGKHYFKVETFDINPNTSTYYTDSVPASAAWKQVTLLWDSLHATSIATGVVTPVADSSKRQAQRVTWVMQGADNTVDSLFVDNVEITGFSDRGIAVTGASTANGAWQFSTNAGTSWTVFSSPLTDNTATLLNSAAQVRFVPNAAYSGSSTIIFRAWNQTDGKANGTAATPAVPNGGVSAYSAHTDTATVQVLSNPITISQQPLSDTVKEGAACTLSVAATNATAYQWRKNGVAITGATGTSYIKNPVTVSDSGNYAVMVKNTTDSLLSQPARVTIVGKPGAAVVTPATDTLSVGGSVTFSVRVGAGTPPFTYQWQQNGTALAGQTASTYAIASAATSSAGTYTVVVTNAAGSAVSGGGVLVVNAPVKAAFTLSDTTLKVPAVVQFTDQSTGPFTKRLWYFGDGTSDTSNAPGPTHQFDSAGVYSVKLVLLSGTTRADSAIHQLKTYKDNPITITGRYSSPGRRRSRLRTTRGYRR